MANLGVVVHGGVGAQVNGLFLQIAQPGPEEAQSGVSQDLGHDLGREAVGEKDRDGLARCKVKSFVVHRELHLVLDWLCTKRSGCTKTGDSAQKVGRILYRKYLLHHSNSL